MFQGIFNYDNPVWRFVGKLGDLILLNILWIICSIPIFTIGASTTAVYYVTLKLVRDDDGYTIKSFFRSFKENFKQATALWLMFLVTGLVLLFDLRFAFRVLNGSSMMRTVFTAAIGALTLIWLFMFTYAFPLQSRFYNPVKRTLFNALFMSIRHFPYTLGMLLIDGALLIISYFSLFLAPQFSVLALMFGFPMLAFINSYLFNRVFKRYIHQEEEQGDGGELRPILEDVRIVRPTKEQAEEKAESSGEPGNEAEAAKALADGPEAEAEADKASED